MSTYRDRVQMGARLLDEQVPGWVEKVDLGTLDLRHSSTCMLGQLYPDFFVGKEALELNIDECEVYGFYVERHRRKGYRRLQRQWSRLILQRRFRAA